MKINKSLSLERKSSIWELRQQCWTQERIAKKLEISQKTVSKILYRINKEYAKRHEEYVDRVKSEQVGQLEYIADEAVQAWERSKDACKVVRQKKAISSDGSPIGLSEQTQEARDQDGDPRYLMTAMKAKEDIRKITGADAPVKSEVKYSELDNLSDDELREKAREAFDEGSTRDIESVGGKEHNEQESVESATRPADAGF